MAEYQVPPTLPEMTGSVRRRKGEMPTVENQRNPNKRGKQKPPGVRKKKVMAVEPSIGV